MTTEKVKKSARAMHLFKLIFIAFHNVLHVSNFCALTRELF